MSDTASRSETLGSGPANRPALSAQVGAAGPHCRSRPCGDPRAAGHGVRRTGGPARRSPGFTRRSRCLVGYAIFGPSRILVLGPDSSVSPMIFAAIVPLLAGGDPTRAIALAGMLALMVGLIEIGLGLGKLGFVADLLSNEVQVGYMNGLALVIIVGQLPKLFGYSVPSGSFGAEFKAFVTGLDETVVRRRGDRRGRLGRPADPAAVHSSHPGGARRHRWRDGHLGNRGARKPRGQDSRRPAAGRPEAGAAVDLGLGRRTAGGRRRRHHPRLAR